VTDLASAASTVQMPVPSLVSVILPNRNHAHFLSRAIDALLAQTHRNFELIVVDDCSSDNSREVVAEYASRDPRVQLEALSTHHGISRAVAAAMSKVRGDYLFFAAADDLVAPTLFAKLVAELERHPDAGLCFSDPAELDEAGRATTFPLYLSKQPAFYGPDALAREWRRNYFHISSNSAVYRAAPFRAAGGYRDDLGWLCDWFVTTVIALRHGVCYLPEQLTFLTVRSDSYSAVNLRNAAAQRRLVERALELFSQPEFADIASRLRQGAILPEYQLRTLVWLVQSAAGRRFITVHLVARTVMRAAWSQLRPFASVRLRRALRRLASAGGMTKHVGAF
jgi:glycosyltransferase involved in cell wall biosynthesis